MYPKLVTLLGGGGLAGAGSFFVGVYLAFQPGWERWAEFFVPWSIVWMAVPFVMLVAYLYLRTRLGQWYVEHDRIDEAIAYCKARIEPHLALRSRKEAMFHRVALGRAYLVRHEYEKVEEVLGTGYAVPTEGRLGLEVHRWRMEAALRAENLVRAHEIWNAVEEVKRPRSERAAMLGCRAELAVRERDKSAYEASFEGALWADPECARAELVEVLEVCRDDAIGEDNDRLLDVLDRVFESVVGQVPGREAELYALRAQLLLRDDKTEEAEGALQAAREADADSRSAHEVERVEALVEEMKRAPSHSQHPN
ncbi:MAG: hypothetical protein ACOCV2_01200 [Persicimonas sp.]